MKGTDMLSEKEIINIRNNMDELEENIFEQESEKQKLYNDNKENVDTRKSKRTSKNISTFFGIIFLIGGIIGALSLSGVIRWAVLSVAIFLTIILFVVAFKKAGEVKALSSVLKDYDDNVRNIDSSIEKFQHELDILSAAIHRNELEKKYEIYIKNHICVYVGFSDSGREGTQQTADWYLNDLQAIVYIDGVEYGISSVPFGAFEVTPGNHVVKITAHRSPGLDISWDTESVARQVKVTEDSVYLFYHWNAYRDNKGLHFALYVKEYDNIMDFLKDTHQD